MARQKVVLLQRRFTARTLVVMAMFCVGAASVRGADLSQSGTQWYPYLEWTVTNASHEGNAYDVEAVATFRHENGETRKTGLFYAGNNLWKFRFTGTQTGTWSVVTSSGDADLNGHAGKVSIRANPDRGSARIHETVRQQVGLGRNGAGDGAAIGDVP